MKNTINLLSFAAAPLSLWEKFYIWALTIGRYIIIITELIVLLAFFYKFRVDNELASAKTDIANNISIMQNNYTQAKTIKNYESRITSLQAITTAQLKPQSIFAHTLSLVPSGIIVLSMDVQTNTSIGINGEIVGTTQSQLNTVQAMANAFKNDPLYTNVTLNNVSTAGKANSTTFSLNMTLVPQSQ